MHIINNVCKEYKDLKLAIENKGKYLDDLEELKTKIQDHWEIYYCDKDTFDKRDDK